MENDDDSPLTLGAFNKYIMRLEANMATKADIADVRTELQADIADVKADIADVKADIADVKAELTARIDKVERVTWLRLDSMEDNMATKKTVMSVKEDTVRIRELMA